MYTSSGDEQMDAAVLFSQVVVDKAQLERNVRILLQENAQVTLRELCDKNPLRQGLAELVAYLQLAGGTFQAVVDEEVSDVVFWQATSQDGKQYTKQARLPRVVFVR